MVRKSKDDLKTNVRELYVNKVKSIYGEIIRFATTTQSTLKLTREQHNEVSDIRVANRKMIEIIKSAEEVNRNVSKYLNSENKYIKKISHQIFPRGF